MSKRATPETVSTMDKERVQELVRQGLNHVEAKKKRYFKKAMANLPKDTEETICGTCGDCLVLRVRAIACCKCKAPICDQCFKKAVAMEKSKFQWQHAIDAKGKCLHPRHPKCSSQAVMKKIRADAKRTLECEVCEHRRMKAEETTYDGSSQPMTQHQDTEFTPYEDDLLDSDEESGPLEIEDRPLTQPNSPVPTITCSEGCPVTNCRECAAINKLPSSPEMQICPRGLIGEPSPKRNCDKCDQSYCGCYPENETPGKQPDDAESDDVDWSAEADKILAGKGGMCASMNGI